MQEEAKNDGQLDCKVVRGLADEMQSSIATAVRTLDDLLNFDKIQTGTFRLELGVVRMCDLIDHIVKEYQLVADEKQISLCHHRLFGDDSDNDVEAPYQFGDEKLVVIGDSIRLAQVVRNLVSNSFKFTPKGGNITIETRLRDGPSHSEEKFKLATGEEIVVPRHGNITVNVVDSGVGMTQDQLANLFQEGRQFNANKLLNGKGSGLGLYISKGIVNQHHGRLLASSGGLEVGGSTFSIELPLYEVNEEIRMVTQRRSHLFGRSGAAGQRKSNCNSWRLYNACTARSCSARIV